MYIYIQYIFILKIHITPEIEEVHVSDSQGRMQ